MRQRHLCAHASALPLVDWHYGQVISNSPLGTLEAYQGYQRIRFAASPVLSSDATLSERPQQ
jgi:hypothetical protein